jgi:outer membrane protein TolC
MSADRRLFPALGATLALVACVPVPEQDIRPVTRTAQSIDAAQTLAPRGDGGWPSDQWWRLAEDPQLSLLIEEGLANSPQVAVALARIRRAESEVKRVGAARLPTVAV